jgi:hypothetical protein
MTGDLLPASTRRLLLCILLYIFNISGVRANLYICEPPNFTILSCDLQFSVCIQVPGPFPQDNTLGNHRLLFIFLMRLLYCTKHDVFGSTSGPGLLFAG